MVKLPFYPLFLLIKFGKITPRSMNFLKKYPNNKFNNSSQSFSSLSLQTLKSNRIIGLVQLIDCGYDKDPEN